MFDFIQKLIYSFLNLQDKLLKKKFNSKTKYCNNYTNSTSKTVFGSAASLQLSTKTELNKAKLEKNVKLVLQKYGNSPQKLIDFIQKNGTHVWQIPFAEKLLKLIGYEVGLIGASHGLKAVYLNIITSVLLGEKINFSQKTDSMIILDSKKELNSYQTIQYFHKWYALKLNLPGFDEKSQNNFQKFVTNANDEQIKELGIDEILGLKEAIARDIESINFVVDLAKSTAGSKNALKKLKAGGASI